MSGYLWSETHQVGAARRQLSLVHHLALILPCIGLLLSAIAGEAAVPEIPQLSIMRERYVLHDGRVRYYQWVWVEARDADGGADLLESITITDPSGRTRTIRPGDNQDMLWGIPEYDQGPSERWFWDPKTYNEGAAWAEWLDASRLIAPPPGVYVVAVRDVLGAVTEFRTGWAPPVPDLGPALLTPAPGSFVSNTVPLLSWTLPFSPTGDEVSSRAYLWEGEWVGSPNFWRGGTCLLDPPNRLATSFSYNFNAGDPQCSHLVSQSELSRGREHTWGVLVNRLEVEGSEGSFPPCQCIYTTSATYARFYVSDGDSIPVSPYPSRDEWNGWYPHRGQLHAHRESDAASHVHPGSDERLLEKYASKGYGFLAITEHQMTPNKKFDDSTWSEVFIDPGVDGIVSMVGSAEDSATESHIVAVGFDSRIDRSLLGSGNTLNDRADRLTNITEAGGLAFIAHPNEDRYPWDHDTLKSLLGLYDGLEIWNRGVFQFGFDQAYAVDAWDNLLKSEDPRARLVFAMAGDDYHPDSVASWFFDGGSVVAWTQSDTPDASDIEASLRYGTFYASQMEKAPLIGTREPEVLACWADPSTQRIYVRLSEPHDVYFIRGRDARRPVARTPDDQGDGTYVASAPYHSDDGYVRVEVVDDSGWTSWLQPIWIDHYQTVSQAIGAGSGAFSVAGISLLEMDGAELAMATPQGGVATVTGSLVAGEDRPSAPPVGYCSFCYQFTPAVSLGGSNSLTISYFADRVRGFHAANLAIYRYDAAGEQWLRLPTIVDENSSTVTASINRLGIYTVSAEVPVDSAEPTVSITSPDAGTEIALLTGITAETTDDQGVMSVQFLVDGWPLDTDRWGGDGWLARLDPANYTAGQKTITAMAKDRVHNEATDAIEVTVAGLMSAPVMTITSPSPGKVMWGDVVATGSWDGDLPLSRGVFTADDGFLGISNQSNGSWSLRAPIPLDQNGERTFKGTGFDKYGNRAEAEVPVVFRVFPDVGFDHWARAHVYATAGSGIVEGYADGNYHPEWQITRAQMAVFIARAIVTPTGEEGIEAYVPPESPTFTDVQASYWAYKHVECLAENGVVEGYPDGLYRPSAIVTRAEMAAYISRAIAEPRGEVGLEGYTPPDTPTFNDLPSDHWAYPYVEYAAENGVVQGYTDGSYLPNRKMTRSQMAVYVARAFDLPM